MDAEFGYELPEHGKPYPHRVHSIGLQFSLVVVLKINNYDIDYLCGGPMQGFSIMFHPPYEGLNAMSKKFHLSPATAAYYTIDPKLIRTSKNAQKYSPIVRRCYMNTERQLRFYKFYTQLNCESECSSNFTFAQCGCVPFAKPRMIKYKLIAFSIAHLN